MSRLRTTSRLAAALLATTCLTPIVVVAVSSSSLADGGGGFGAGAGAGGADSLGGAGSPGTSSATAGGGGGGAGVTGGNGGSGSGGSGGSGGTSPGAPGQSVGGNGGGGGGAHGEVVSGPGTIGAATGGSGGSSGALGGGGAGGYGAAVTGSGAFTNSGIVRGGVGGGGAFGGSGGSGIAFGAPGSTLGTSGSIGGGAGGASSAGSGASGGAGVSGANLGIDNTGTIGGGIGGEGLPGGSGGAGISGSGLAINNSSGATITGGVGGLAPEDHAGAGGAGISGSSSTVTNSGSITGGTGGSGALDGDGGTGISGSGLTITNTTTGSIAGGAGGLGANGGAGISVSSTTVINSGSITGGSGSTPANAITFTGGTNVLELQAGSTITGNAVAFSAADTLRLGGGTNASLGVGLIGSAAQFRNFGRFEKTGTSTWILTGTPGQATPWTITQGTLAVGSAGSLDAGSTLTFNGGTLQAVAALSLANAIVLNGAGTLDTNGNDVTLAGNITGSAGLTKTGAGTLFLDGASSYAGTTSVNQGRLAIGTGTFSANSAFALAAAGTLDIGGTNQTIGSLTGSGTVTNGGAAAAILTVGGNGASTSFDGLLQDGTSTFGLTKTGGGRLSLTGANTYTGPTSVLAGTLAVNGSIISDVTVGAAGTLGGTGTIFGSVTNNGALAPGNSIGTLTVNGSYTQAAGSTYQVELNSAGQGDRINVTGAPGTATINGGTVQVLASGGSYGRSTTYTILNATGGVTGTYAGISSNFAFLRPSLAYDANNVFLTLTLQGFSFTSLTPNQRAVANALDRSFADATGDFGAVLGTIAGLDTVQGPRALNTLSGEPYASFGTMNTASAAMFMNALGQQMAAARGAQANGTRQALAQACDADACDDTGRWNTWASALGGLGSVQGDGNASTLTYNFGGAAAGLDYRIDPSVLLGVAAGYTSGSLRVDNFVGQGWSDSVAVVAYGSFTPSAWYVDALAGYAHFDNRLQRQISFPGVQRIANGSTQANQAFGQIETGYKLPVPGIAAASVTPFASLQLSTTTQSGFSEWGANSIDLAVAAQTTTSARTILGVDLASAFELANTRTLELGLRLGWSHEHADTSRPMTAAFTGAPLNPFTVYGAAPQRDAAVLGFQAHTKISDSAQVYVRYDGTLSGGSDNHTLNAGVRMTW